MSHFHVRSQIERRMELVRLASHNTHKRLVSCLQGQLGMDTEKRHVRSTWRLNSLSSYITKRYEGAPRENIQPWHLASIGLTDDGRNSSLDTAEPKIKHI